MTVIADTLQRLPSQLRTEISENRYRKDWTSSEMYAAYKSCLPHVSAAARERQRKGGRLKASSNLSQAEKGRTIDVIADLLNTSPGTLRKIIAIHEAAKIDPGLKCLAEQADQDGNVDAAFKALKEVQRRNLLQQADSMTLTLPVTGDGLVRRGDVWRLGNHRLMCGNSTSGADVQTLLAGGKPHLMVTDQPWGVSLKPAWRATHWHRPRIPTGFPDDNADWRAAYKLFPGDVIYVFHSEKTEHLVRQGLEEAGFKVRQRIDWVKQQPVIGRQDYHAQKESCFYAVKQGRDRHWNGQRDQSDVWSIPQDRKRADWNEHGARKPVKCMLRPIENNSKPSDAVYDPFVGSGTTIIAAEISGRRCYAMEIVSHYCALAIKRWQSCTGKSAILETRAGSHSVETVREIDNRPRSK